MAKSPAKRTRSKTASTKTASSKSPGDKSAGSSRSRAKAPSLESVVIAALEDMKASNIKVMDVSKLTAITDTMVIACGNSDRHVRSIADNVIVQAKAAGARPYGTEGERDGEWVLVDLP